MLGRTPTPLRTAKIIILLVDGTEVQTLWQLHLGIGTSQENTTQTPNETMLSLTQRRGRTKSSPIVPISCPRASGSEILTSAAGQMAQHTLLTLQEKNSSSSLILIY